MNRCGFTVYDAEGEPGPCDRPATGWRWYQGHNHEDALDVACELHSNEGGRRLHDAESAAALARQTALGNLKEAHGWKARALYAESMLRFECIDDSDICEDCGERHAGACA